MDHALFRVKLSGGVNILPGMPVTFHTRRGFPMIALGYDHEKGQKTYIGFAGSLRETFGGGCLEIANYIPRQDKCDLVSVATGCGEVRALVAVYGTKLGDIFGSDMQLQECPSRIRGGMARNCGVRDEPDHCGYCGIELPKDRRLPQHPDEGMVYRPVGKYTRGNSAGPVVMHHELVRPHEERLILLSLGAGAEVVVQSYNRGTPDFRLAWCGGELTTLALDHPIYDCRGE